VLCRNDVESERILFLELHVAVELDSEIESPTAILGAFAQ